MTTKVGVETYKVLEEAKRVLIKNNQGEWTIPAGGLYPHQWLWDSCFISIGLRHISPQRAAAELQLLLRGQWTNGMMPHMIFTPEHFKLDDSSLWSSKNIPGSPIGLATSGITQPPLLAEATQRVADLLPLRERKAFLLTMVPAIIRYHEWLYRERDPEANGLVLLFHPWETGLDNSPAWIEELRKVHTPHWVKLMDLLAIDRWFKWLRRDTLRVPADQRMKTSDLLRLYHAAMDLRRRGFDATRILRHPRRHFIVESVSFNSILIRNNQILAELAESIRLDLPGWLIERFKLAAKGLDVLCDPKTGVCYHRNFDTKQIEEEPTISLFMPLYAGTLSKKQAEQLVRKLKDKDSFWLPYPVPSAPKNSQYFSEKRYWQGPTWLNTNWLIVDGLKRYGYTEEARYIAEKSIELVEKSGSYEYFSPLDGKGYGANDFSWTAALAIDFVKQLY